jgi:hypothetical protein
MYLCQKFQRVPTEAWSARVSRELLENIDKREIARQEIINEIIYSEEKFLSDLTVLKEVRLSINDTWSK